MAVWTPPVPAQVQGVCDEVSGVYENCESFPGLRCCFQVVVTNLGFVSSICGAFPGASSDTTIYRRHPPPMHPWQYVLGDKAYVSVAHCLPPIKRSDPSFSRSQRNAFNGVMGHYRVRVEHGIGWLKCWGALGGRWRSRDMRLLSHCAFIIACIKNLHCCFRLPYMPYVGP